MELQEVVSKLESFLAAGILPDRDRIFADSLVNGQWGFKSRGFLTEKQVSAAVNMIRRHEGTPDSAGVSLAGVHSLLIKAREHLKYPKLTLQLANGMPVVVYLSGKRSKYPDTVNLKVTEAPFAVEWYGRILDNGEWHKPYSSNPEVVSQLKTLLERLADKPAEVAAEYGHLSGNCCFCHRPLTDERSTDVGYGPVCAKHYGLSWG
jgi:hypothetical protein